MSLDRSFKAGDQARAAGWRCGALLLAGLLLAGCGGKAPKAGPSDVDSRIPPSLAPRFWPPAGWAWGRLSIADRIIRYGVAGPGGVARAEIVIASGYGEPIEAWFETVSDLNARGYAVWVVEGGAGGLEAVLKIAERASPGAPLALLASSDAAQAAASVAPRWPQLTGVVITSPDFSARPAFGPAWTREALDARQRGLTHDRWRGAVVKAWQTANPDLRRPVKMDEPSKSKAASPAASLLVPMLIVSAQPVSDEVQAVCRRAVRCEERNFPAAGRDLHLETDRIRGEWLAAVEQGLNVKPGPAAAGATEGETAPRDHGL